MKAAALLFALVCPLFAGPLEDAANAFQSGDQKKAAELWTEYAAKGVSERRSSGQAALLRGQYELAVALLGDVSLKEDAVAQECLSRAALNTGNDALAWEAVKASVKQVQSGEEAERRLRRLVALSQLPPHQAERTAEMAAPDAPPALKAALLMLYNTDYRKMEAGKLAAVLPKDEMLCNEVVLQWECQSLLEKGDLSGTVALVAKALSSRQVPAGRWYTFLVQLRAQAGDHSGVISAIQAWQREDLKSSGPSLLMVRMFGRTPGSDDAFARAGVEAFPKDLEMLDAAVRNIQVSPQLQLSLACSGWKAVTAEDRYVVTKLLAGTAAATGMAGVAMKFLESEEARQVDAAEAAIARVYVLCSLGKNPDAIAALQQAEEKFPGHKHLSAARACLKAAEGKAAEAMSLLEKITEPSVPDLLEYLALALTSNGKPEARMLNRLPVKFAVPFLEQAIPALAKRAQWERIVQILQPALDSIKDSPLLLIELGRALCFTRQQEQAWPVLLEAMARLQSTHQPPPFQDPDKGLLLSDYRLAELMRAESLSLLDQERQGSPAEDATAPAVRCLALLYRITSRRAAAESKVMIRRVNGIQRNTGLPLAEDAGTGEVVLPRQQQHYKELWENSGGSMMAALWLVHRYDAPAIPHAAAEMVWKGDHGKQEWRDAAVPVLAVHEGTADPAPFLEWCFRGEREPTGRFLPGYFWPAFAAKLSANVQLPQALAKKIGEELGIGSDETRGLCALRLRTPAELAAYIKDRFAGAHGSSADYSIFGGMSGNGSLLWLQKTPEHWARRKMADTLPHLASATQRLHVSILAGLDAEKQAALKEVRASTLPEDTHMASWCALAAGDVSGAYEAWSHMKTGTEEHRFPESEAAFMVTFAWTLGWEVPEKVKQALREKEPNSLTRGQKWHSSRDDLLPLILKGEKPTPAQSMKLVYEWRALLRLAAGVADQDRAADLAVTMLRRTVTASLNGWSAKPEDGSGFFDSLYDFNIALQASEVAELAWLKLKGSTDAEGRWAAGYLAARCSHQFKEQDEAHKFLHELKNLQPRCPLLESHLR